MVYYNQDKGKEIKAVRKRTCKCTKKICEGAELSVTIEITLNDFTTVKEAEAKLKEMFAEECSCPLHEIKLKLLSKRGKKELIQKS